MAVHRARPPCIVYLIDTDISRDNGAGVNERGFVDAVCKMPELVCVLPEPLPSSFRIEHPRVEYVFGHRSTWWRYPLWMGAAFVRLLRLRTRYDIKGVATRLGLFPLAQWLFSIVTGIPILLAKHSGYQPLTPLSIRDVMMPLSAAQRRAVRIRMGITLARPIHKAVVRRAISVDSPSPLCRQTVLWRDRCPPTKVAVLPNGTNTDLFTPLNRSEQRARLGLGRWPRIVGYVGALNRDKRCMDYLVCAIALAVRQGLDAGCVIVGGGPDRPALETLIETEGIARNVLFVGVVPHEQVPAYMAAFDVGVDLCAAPMRTASGEVAYSAYSQKMAQYLACGLPVLVWDLLDNQFVAQCRLGAVARLFDVADLAAQTQHLLTLDAEEASALRERARLYAEDRLSYAAIAAQRLTLWKAALDRHARIPPDSALTW